MKYSIRKNWILSFNTIRTNPVLLLPFIFIAFFEGLALELIYFSAREPLSFIANPIIKKFFSSRFIHYPGNFVLLPKLFYYAQMFIYAFIAVALMSIAINIFRNIKLNLPLKPNALIRNASRGYFAFATFGIMMVALVVMLKRADILIIGKCMEFLAKYIPDVLPKIYFVSSSLFLFFTNIILQALLVLTIPIMVIQQKPLLKALGKSVYLGFRNFLYIFPLLFLPFLFYLPAMLLKSGSLTIAQKTFPEITVIIIAAGIIVTILIDCFVLVCAAQFLLDKEG